MDRLSPDRRSANMARIRSKDTAPEMAVRRFLHAAGLRYRLHRDRLPGKPDLVFPKWRICVFVHGCFWHGCRHCIDGTRRVKSNIDYWSGKVAENRARDARHKAALEEAGWTVFTIWECQVTTLAKLRNLAGRIRRVTARAAAKR
jgi:DNA mismatch endonuclease (patch repair protein)